MKNKSFVLIIAFTAAFFSTGAAKRRNPVSLETIQKTLIATYEDKGWEISEYRFGRLLCGSIKINSIKTSWSDKAGIIICDKDMSNVGKKLIEASISAPYQVVGKSKRYQILTWQSAELDEIRKLIDLVNKLDT
jgi:hypothetical protein